MSSDLHTVLEAAGIDPATLGPFAALVEALDAVVQLRIDGAAGDLKAARSNSAAEAMLAAVDGGLHPDHDYLPEQGAAFLGIEASTYNKLSRSLLPRRKGGYARGVDIMAYRGDITYEEARAYKEAKRSAVKRLVS